jgi:hypothetical protein
VSRGREDESVRLRHPLLVGFDRVRGREREIEIR